MTSNDDTTPSGYGPVGSGQEEAVSHGDYAEEEKTLPYGQRAASSPVVPSSLDPDQAETPPSGVPTPGHAGWAEQARQARPSVAQEPGGYDFSRPSSRPGDSRPAGPAASGETATQPTAGGAGATGSGYGASYGASYGTSQAPPSYSAPAYGSSAPSAATTGTAGAIGATSTTSAASAAPTASTASTASAPSTAPATAPTASYGAAAPYPAAGSSATTGPDLAAPAVGPAVASGSGGERRRGPGWGALAGATAVAVLLGAGGGAAVSSVLGGGSDSPAASATAPTAIATGDTTQVVESAGETPDWEAVVAAVSNAVVAITFESGDSEGGVGSGVIYDSSGHVLTNNHVVSTARQLYVTLADGRMYEAEVTGTDPATDLAVIQIVDAPDDLTVAQFGNSDSLVTGQDVMAIGNPLGLSSTATTGIISALNRPVVNSEDDSGASGPGANVYTNAIQIDAAINPGNSGGPLFDEKGYVIGITSSIASIADSSGNIGIGFAIPSDLAKKVADQLIESGSATHAYLGVGLTNGTAQADGEERGGAEVTSVESGSPADEAGLEKGDVIVAIDGKTTAQDAALTGFVRQYSAGDTVTLTVIRDGSSRDVKVTLAERPDS
ncbi:PDZ domain-containing protein [Actinomyces lilanjuaniae]|uniref:PDZ domain-containing protein n=1 Tax=Actinomyces lilanjuaniae TaxID=2321394 RepID=A0ABM6Z4Q5_9ACTO|nr:trypsin-like peptidase domain-containing protein [Actinomyces lilanjuaniae]AYD90305.1 PDZ domain-containing protein [Actinomyces lilanjuaniae]